MYVLHPEVLHLAELFFAVKSVLSDIIHEAKLMKEERKKLTSLNLALVLVHDVLLAGGIQAGDGPLKQAILRHKTRLHGEFQKLKIKRGVSSNAELVQSGDARAGSLFPLPFVLGMLECFVQPRFRAMSGSTPDCGLSQML